MSSKKTTGKPAQTHRGRKGGATTAAANPAPLPPLTTAAVPAAAAAAQNAGAPTAQQNDPKQASAAPAGPASTTTALQAAKRKNNDAKESVDSVKRVKPTSVSSPVAAAPAPASPAGPAGSATASPTKPSGEANDSLMDDDTMALVSDAHAGAAGNGSAGELDAAGNPITGRKEAVADDGDGDDDDGDDGDSDGNGESGPAEAKPKSAASGKRKAKGKASKGKPAGAGAQAGKNKHWSHEETVALLDVIVRHAKEHGRPGTWGGDGAVPKQWEVIGKAYDAVVVADSKLAGGKHHKGLRKFDARQCHAKFKNLAASISTEFTKAYRELSESLHHTGELRTAELLLGFPEDKRPAPASQAAADHVATVVGEWLEYIQHQTARAPSLTINPTTPENVMTVLQPVYEMTMGSVKRQKYTQYAELLEQIEAGGAKLEAGRAAKARNAHPTDARAKAAIALSSDAESVGSAAGAGAPDSPARAAPRSKANEEKNKLAAAQTAALTSISDAMTKFVANTMPPPEKPQFVDTFASVDTFLIDHMKLSATEAQFVLDLCPTPLDLAVVTEEMLLAGGVPPMVAKKVLYMRRKYQ